MGLVGGGCTWIIALALVLLTLNFQFEPDHGPKTGPELDNLIKLTSPLSFKLIADTLVREISSVLCLNLSLARSVRPNLEPG